MPEADSVKSALWKPRAAEFARRARAIFDKPQYRREGGRAAIEMGVFKFRQFDVDDSGCGMKICSDSVLLGHGVAREYRDARTVADVGARLRSARSYMCPIHDIGKIHGARAGARCGTSLPCQLRRHAMGRQAERM